MRGKVLRAFSTSIEVTQHQQLCARSALLSIRLLSLVQVRVHVLAEHITSGTVRRICDALLVFVALGSDFRCAGCLLVLPGCKAAPDVRAGLLFGIARPTEVVQCLPETDEEKTDYEVCSKFP
jgi:hypothetical protein